MNKDLIESTIAAELAMVDVHVAGALFKKEVPPWFLAEHTSLSNLRDPRLLLIAGQLLAEVGADGSRTYPDLHLAAQGVARVVGLAMELSGSTHASEIKTIRSLTEVTRKILPGEVTCTDGWFTTTLQALLGIEALDIVVGEVLAHNPAFQGYKHAIEEVRSQMTAVANTYLRPDAPASSINAEELSLWHIHLAASPHLGARFGGRVFAKNAFSILGRS